MVTAMCKEHDREIDDLRNPSFCESSCYVVAKVGRDYICPSYKEIPDPIPISKQMDKELHVIACEDSHHSSLRGLEQMFMDAMDSFREDDGTDWYPVENIQLNNTKFIDYCTKRINSMVDEYTSEANSYINSMNKVKERLTSPEKA